MQVFRIVGDQTGNNYAGGSAPEGEPAAFEAVAVRVKGIVARSNNVDANDILCIEIYGGQDENDMPIWLPRPQPPVSAEQDLLAE